MEEYELVSYGNIGHCDFCEQPPVEYLMIASQDGIVQTPPYFLCSEHRKIVIHNLILYKQVTADDLNDLESHDPSHTSYVVNIGR